MIHRPSLAILRRPALVRPMPMLAAAAALGLTLALGNQGSAVPHPIAGWFVATGLCAIACVGLLAWHIARLTALPRADPAAAALVAALIPAILLPGLGSDALIVVQALAIWALLRCRAQRVVALMVQCGAILAVAQPLPGAMVNALLYMMMLGSALLLLFRGLSGAANDNPSMKRGCSESMLWPSHGYARSDSMSGSWGVA